MTKNLHSNLKHSLYGIDSFFSFNARNGRLRFAIFCLNWLECTREEPKRPGNVPISLPIGVLPLCLPYRIYCLRIFGETAFFDTVAEWVPPAPFPIFLLWLSASVVLSEIRSRSICAGADRMVKRNLPAAVFVSIRSGML